MVDTTGFPKTKRSLEILKAPGTPITSATFKNTMPQKSWINQRSLRS